MEISIQLIGFLWITSHVFCFNLEPRSKRMYEYPYAKTQGRDSYFGFSVALQHIDNDNTNWVIVGAPRANSSYHNVAEIPEPGALFRCSLKEDMCQELQVDRTGNVDSGSGLYHYKDMKNYGWIGGSLDSQPSYQNSRQATCVCAPNWKDQSKKKKVYMNGACYIGLDSISNDNNYIKSTPLVNKVRQIEDDYMTYAYGQAGFSVHFPNDSTKLIIGAPGVFQWTGSVLLLKDQKEGGSGGPAKRDIQDQNEIFLFDGNAPKTDKIEENSLLGYSITSGTFLQRDKIQYAAGAPQASNSFGKVIVFDFPSRGEYNLLIKKEFKGEQIGEYFGGAVTAADINGDGLDDLIVSSPLYTHYNAMLADVGRIHTFLSKEGSGLSVDPKHHYGKSINLARFGSSLASLGDLNFDGYEDIAVGAPWEDSGRVYIFMGSESGLKDKWSQLLSKEDFTHPGLKGFGMSISRGIDIDNNGYPDVAIGSFLSGDVLVVRSRPVARLSGNVSLDPSSVAWDEEKNVTLTTCIRYKGHRLPQKISVQARIILDYRYGDGVLLRAVFPDKNNTHSFVEELVNNKNTCKDHQITVKKDKVHPDRHIAVRLEYNINQNQDLQLMQTPITDPFTNNYNEGYINIAKQCKNNTCQVDMKANATFINGSNKYVVRGKVNWLKVVVSNSEEPAYFPNLTVTADTPLTLKTLTSDDCLVYNDEKSLLRCNLSNPIRRYDKPDEIDVGVKVNEQQLMRNTSHLKLQINVTGEGKERTANDTFLTMTLQVATQANIELHGSSEEEKILYKLTENKTSILNKSARFNHTYILIKKGPTPLEGINLVIDIPVNFSDGTQFVKIYDWKKIFSNQISCQLSGARVSSGNLKTNMNSANNVAVTSVDNGSQSSSQTHDVVSVEKETDVHASHFNCSSSFIKCAQLNCHLTNWTLDTQYAQSAKVSVELGIDFNTIAKHISISNGVVFVSNATATITSLNPLWKFIGNSMTTKGIATYIQPGIRLSKSISWWVIVLVVLGSLLLLGIITYVLHKKGFFKREKKKELKYERARLEKPLTGGETNTAMISN